MNTLMRFEDTYGVKQLFELCADLRNPEQVEGYQYYRQHKLYLHGSLCNPGVFNLGKRDILKFKRLNITKVYIVYDMDSPKGGNNIIDTAFFKEKSSCLVNDCIEAGIEVLFIPTVYAAESIGLYSIYCFGNDIPVYDLWNSDNVSKLHMKLLTSVYEITDRQVKHFGFIADISEFKSKLEKALHFDKFNKTVLKMLLSEAHGLGYSDAIEHLEELHEYIKRLSQQSDSILQISEKEQIKIVTTTKGEFKMVNKKELTKVAIKSSAALLSAVVIAGSTLSTSGSTVYAKAATNPVQIETVVDTTTTTATTEAPQAEVPVEWSTAMVYTGARYGKTWGGTLTGGQGTCVHWEYLTKPGYVFAVDGATLTNGRELQYQFLKPLDLTGCSIKDTYVAYSDDSEPTTKSLLVGDMTVSTGGHLWEKFADIVKAESYSTRAELGNTYTKVEDDGQFYRITLNITDLNENLYTPEDDRLVYKGFISYVEEKATGKIYEIQYKEQEAYYDPTRALTVVYSFLPVIQ